MTHFWKRTIVIQILLTSLASSSHWVWVNLYRYWILDVKRAPKMSTIFGWQLLGHATMPFIAQIFVDSVQLANYKFYLHFDFHNLESSLFLNLFSWFDLRLGKNIEVLFLGCPNLQNYVKWGASSGWLIHVVLIKKIGHPGCIHVRKKYFES